jgi:mRNA interferase MazF
MLRGEIWWANLPAPTGSEPGYRRPVLIVSADSFNRSGIQTVVVVAITSNLKLAAAPGNVRLNRRQSGLARSSVVNLSQIVTMNKAWLASRIGQVPHSVFKEVEEGLRRVLDLEKTGS